MIQQAVHGTELASGIKTRNLFIAHISHAAVHVVVNRPTLGVDKRRPQLAPIERRLVNPIHVLRVAMEIKVLPGVNVTIPSLYCSKGAIDIHKPKFFK